MSHTNSDSKVAAFREDLAKKFRAARAGKRLSQAQVGELSGSNHVRVGEIERGDTDPRISTVIRIASVLDLEITVDSAA